MYQEINLILFQDSAETFLYEAIILFGTESVTDFKEVLKDSFYIKNNKRSVLNANNPNTWQLLMGHIQKLNLPVHKKIIRAGQGWRTPVIQALWEAEAG